MIIKAILKFYNDARGFGFATLPDGREVFIHWSKGETPGCLKKLNPGDIVQFELYENEKGLYGVRVRKSDD